jgi:hypothetical protein
MMMFVMASDFAFIVVGLVKAASGPGYFWSTVFGAVVGGCVSLATTLLVERQKAKNAVAAEARQQQASGQLAARVVALELRDMESVLRVAVERTPWTWPPVPDFAFASTAWSEHSADLAAVLPDDAWQTVAAAYAGFAYSALTPPNEAGARTLLTTVDEALAALEAWTAKTR